MTTEKEAKTKKVFGETFNLYSKEDYIRFIEPLYIRFAANGISTDIFRGKNCLDAGCGGGRGSVFMLQNGAKHVTGVDLSEKNIETSRKWAEVFGFKNAEFTSGNLLDLPFEDETFDMVWCNGVLHHTENPDKGLQEITRVLKQKGWLWLYLYGAGGVYWYAMDMIRERIGKIPQDRVVKILHDSGVPAGLIAEYIDDWYVPICRKYRVKDVQRRLVYLGFVGADNLKKGTGYDTSMRLVCANERERLFLGEGDIRFFVQKIYSSPPSSGFFGLPLVDPEPTDEEVVQFCAAIHNASRDITKPGAGL